MQELTDKIYFLHRVFAHKPEGRASCRAFAEDDFDHSNRWSHRANRRRDPQTTWDAKVYGESMDSEGCSTSTCRNTFSSKVWGRWVDICWYWARWELLDIDVRWKFVNFTHCSRNGQGGEAAPADNPDSPEPSGEMQSYQQWNGSMWQHEIERCWDMPNMLSYDQFGICSRTISSEYALVRSVRIAFWWSCARRPGNQSSVTEAGLWEYWKWHHVAVCVFGRTHFARCQASCPNGVHSTQDKRTQHFPASDKASWRARWNSDICLVSSIASEDAAAEAVSMICPLYNPTKILRRDVNVRYFNLHGRW